jgi:predicted Zn finger-like uncharacterized protein
MILVCPSCDTRYFADDTSIGKEGRRVRCATCGHAWYAKLQEEGAPPEPEDTGLTREQVERLRQTAAANSAARAGPHAEFRAREHAKRKRNKGRAVGFAWLAGGGVFVIAIIAAVLFRNEVAEAFPRVASIYKLVGLDVNRFGLVFENVDGKRSFDGTTPVLTVTGSVVNKTDEKRDAPQLRVALRDESGNEVQSWTDALSVPALNPGDRVEFSSRKEAPPVETYRLTVTFVHKPGGEHNDGEASVEPAKDPAHAPAGAAKPADGHAPAAAPSGDKDYKEPGGSGRDDGDEHATGGETAKADPAPAAPAPAKPLKEADHH